MSIDVSEARKRLKMIAQMSDLETSKRINDVINKFLVKDDSAPVRRARAANGGRNMMHRIRDYAAEHPMMSKDDMSKVLGIRVKNIINALSKKSK